jgi:CRP/FNR family cyclic AMP-dependent transcriptional regulator
MVAHLDDSGIDVVQFPKGKVLFRQGSKGDAAYIVNSGAIGIYREAQGKKIPLATVRRGELFGEMAVIDNSPRMATAFAVEDSTLMKIPIDVMLKKMKTADPFIRALIHMLMTNLRGVHDTHTPKSRSFTDAVNSLGRQCDVVSRFLLSDSAEEVREDLGDKLKKLDDAVKNMRRIAMAHRSEDRRDDSLPSDGLPVG